MKLAAFAFFAFAIWEFCNLGIWGCLKKPFAPFAPLHHAPILEFGQNEKPICPICPCPKLFRSEKKKSPAKRLGTCA